LVHELEVSYKSYTHNEEDSADKEDRFNMSKTLNSAQCRCKFTEFNKKRES